MSIIVYLLANEAIKCEETQRQEVYAAYYSFYIENKEQQNKREEDTNLLTNKLQKYIIQHIKDKISTNSNI